MARATEAEHEQRIEQFAELILRGAQRRDLIAFAKPRWHLQERQIDKDIRAARERISQSAHVDRTFEIGQALRRLNLMLALALKEGNVALALKAQHEIDVLLGLGARGERRRADRHRHDAQELRGDRRRASRVGRTR